MGHPCLVDDLRVKGVGFGSTGGKTRYTLRNLLVCGSPASPTASHLVQSGSPSKKIDLIYALQQLTGMQLLEKENFTFGREKKRKTDKRTRTGAGSSTGGVADRGVSILILRSREPWRKGGQGVSRDARVKLTLNSGGGRPQRRHDARDARPIPPPPGGGMATPENVDNPPLFRNYFGGIYMRSVRGASEEAWGSEGWEGGG